MLSRILFAVWFILLLVTFTTTVFTMTVVQTRVAKQHGWKALGDRPFIELYWKNLSTKERALLWPGLIMFFGSLLLGTVWKVISFFN